MATSQEKPPPPENTDMPGAADYLLVSERTVAKLVASGELPFFRVGRQIRFNFEELRRWARERSAMTDSEVKS